MRTSVLSERVYSAKVERNPFAVAELRSIWQRLEADPYTVGHKLDLPPSHVEHWVYESPRMPFRARLRVYFTTDAARRIVNLQALDII